MVIRTDPRRQVCIRPEARMPLESAPNLMLGLRTALEIHRSQRRMEFCWVATTLKLGLVSYEGSQAFAIGPITCGLVGSLLENSART